MSEFLELAINYAKLAKRRERNFVRVFVDDLEAAGPVEPSGPPSDARADFEAVTRALMGVAV